MRRSPSISIHSLLFCRKDLFSIFRKRKLKSQKEERKKNAMKKFFLILVNTVLSRKSPVISTDGSLFSLLIRYEIFRLRFQAWKKRVFWFNRFIGFIAAHVLCAWNTNCKWQRKKGENYRRNNAISFFSSFKHTHKLLEHPSRSSVRLLHTLRKKYNDGKRRNSSHNHQ